MENPYAKYNTTKDIHRHALMFAYLRIFYDNFSATAEKNVMK